MQEIKDILKIEGINCKGFGVIPKVVMMDRDISIEAKTIYAYFCSLSGNGTTSFPSRDTIVYHLQISKDLYYKHFKLLTQYGFIKVERIGDFPYKNLYTLINNPKKYQEKENPYDKAYSQIKYSGLKAHGFGTVPRVLMLDQRLHIKAKGIYAYFCSYAGSGIAAFPKLDNILYHLNIGRQAYYKYYNELVNCNYITVIQRKSEGGKFTVNDYYLNETPDFEIVEKKLPCDDLQDNGKSIENAEVLPCDDLQDNGKSIENTEVSPCDDLPYNDTPYNDLPYNDTQDSNINRSNINNFNINNNQSIPADSIDQIEDKYKFYRKLVLNNIEYEHLKAYAFKNEPILDDIAEVLINAVTTSKKTIRIAGEDKPTELVKSAFLKLNSSHIEYVIISLKNTVTKINNPESYILTALYKAPMTMNTFYTNWVQSDMYGAK